MGCKMNHLLLLIHLKSVKMHLSKNHFLFLALCKYDLFVKRTGVGGGWLAGWLVSFNFDSS